MKQGCIIVVVCPLKSISSDQIKEAISMGITATSLSESLEDVANGKFQLVFASAEEVLDKEFTKVLKCKSKLLHKNLAALVVDECHTVKTWTGKRSTTKWKKSIAAFRASFGKLAVLHSLCKQGTPVAALTGTADEKTRSTVKETLALKKDFLTVYVSPNRTNLTFSVQKVN
ncbi:ATP-dependent DNA helicase Q-like SIM [Dendronephthya gigantea]|uniref:ATP-dependent DNA helicase Q-like SIM n=1 Tax=Dendronephthya gigantea TaxID=151771 RepID=UPI00106BDA67|nr:ATP-dependent DNA helicase Q-like SIM [Dendronephthya gigantea]